MASHLTLRYSSTGKARVYLNGFLIINDLSGESSSNRLEPYAIPGRNELRIESLSAPDSVVSAQVAWISDADGSELQILGQSVLPDPSQPHPYSQLLFDLPPDLPRWSWMAAQPAPVGSEQRINDTLQQLALALQQGPDSVLLDLLKLKHSEIGTALAIGKDKMDQGMLQGMAARRQSPGFQVDLAAAGQQELAWLPDRRIVRVLRKDGHDAIMLQHQGMRSGFATSLGFAQGQWWVLR